MSGLLLKPVAYAGFFKGGGSKVTSKICSQSILWQMNDLVQRQKMKSKFTVRNANKTFQTKNNQALMIKHTSILNIIRFAIERSTKN